MFKVDKMSEYDRNELLRKWELERELEARRESTNLLSFSGNSGGPDSQSGIPLGFELPHAQDEAALGNAPVPDGFGDQRRELPRHSFMMNRRSLVQKHLQDCNSSADGQGGIEAIAPTSNVGAVTVDMISPRVSGTSSRNAPEALAAKGAANSADQVKQWEKEMNDQ